METQRVPCLINSSDNQYNQSETTEGASFDEQLTAALLGEDFPYPLPAKSCTTYPDQSHWDFEYDLVDQFITPPSYSSNSSGSYDNNDDNNNNYDDVNDNTMVSPGVQEPGRQSNKRKEVTEKQAGNGGGTRKRKRHPSQVQDHILAERKRREILGHMFISLSTMIPGLKKIDKTSILGEAIKHMKHLQEKVNVLEKVASQQKSVKSMVVVKKYHSAVDNEDSDDTGNGSSSIVSDNSSSDNDDCGGCGSNNGSSNNVMNLNNSIPEIEVKITDETLLLKIYCETQNGVMAKLLEVVDNHHMRVTNCSLLPFENLALDITIVAQIQEGFDMNVEGFVRSIRSVLRPAAPCCQASN